MEAKVENVNDNKIKGTKKIFYLNDTISSDVEKLLHIIKTDGIRSINAHLTS